MTLPIERSRSRRPITWLTLIGVILLPVVIGGILIAALYNPTERLDNLTAAIVNEDEAVELDGQLVPLGRQLTAGLVEGPDTLDSNLNWTLSNPDDAEEGLADGTYAAVITIPENFTSAALSTRPGETPEQALIEVTTPPDSLIVDDAITTQVATAAASIMGDELSSTYLENVLLGFTTLGEQLGEAADGAGELADGADTAADGTVTLADGIGQLAGGAGELANGANGISSGIGQLAGGAGELANGANGISSGAAGIESGAGALADGTTEAAEGLDAWAAGANASAEGAQSLADGLALVVDQVSALPDVPTDLVTSAQSLADNSEEIITTATDAAAELTALADGCLAQGGTAELCDTIVTIAEEANNALPTVTSALDNSQQLADGVAGLAGFEPQLVAGLEQLNTGASKLSTGVSALADGANEAANGLDALALGMGSLADGAGDLSDGAATWSAGATTWADGAATASTGVGTWAAGAGTWASGATEAATGADDLADGLGTLADGTDELADGLTTATDEIPSYTDAEAAALASVVADPVSAEGAGNELFGASAIPLLAMLALWFGGLGSFIALQAVSRRALTSRQSSALLAARGLAPAAAIGAAQGLLVAGVVQIAASYEWSEWFAFAGVAIVAGVAFAAVNQALVAAFGGAGRWVAAIIGVLAVATGIVSTVPGVLSELAGLMPTSPAYNGMLSALTSTDGIGAALVGLVIWAVIGFIVTVVAVTRRRSVTSRSLLASPATA